MVVALAIAVGAVFLGNLNAVAAVVTMFFLTVYGTVNLVAAFEVLSGDPSWRPKIKVPWPVTLIGGLACIVVMFLINPVAGLIALVAEFSLWMYLSRRAQKARWGDARRGPLRGPDPLGADPAQRAPDERPQLAAPRPDLCRRSR